MGHMSIVSGGVDNTVKLFDLHAQAETIVGSHELPINCVEYASNIKGILTGSWDRTMKIWDARQRECCGTYEQSNGKVYSMSTVGYKIAVATSESKVLIWDMRNLKSYLLRHLLQHQPKCVKISPNKKIYVIGSNDGRVAVEYIKRDPEKRKLRHVFRCHRMRSYEGECVFRVNSISFHSRYTFATGGSNGSVNIWDGFSKHRLSQLYLYPLSIASLDFSDDGTKLAVGCSDLNVDGKPINKIPKPKIYVRTVKNEDVRPIN